MNDGDCRRRVNDWFIQWRAPLRKFLAGRRMISARDLDDVAQEVFLRLMRYQRAELVENPQAYLYRVAMNVASEWAVRTRNMAARDLSWVAELGRQSTESEMERLHAQDQVERALGKLSPRQRLVLKLQFYEGLSYTQIAAQLGMTERSVKRAVAKSYQQLRRELQPALL